MRQSAPSNDFDLSFESYFGLELLAVFILFSASFLSSSFFWIFLTLIWLLLVWVGVVLKIDRFIAGQSQ